MEDYVDSVIQYNGYTIKILQDADAENPREFCNTGTLYTAHRRYRPEKEFDDYFNSEDVFDEHFDFKDSFDKQYIALKVYLYDHSGLSVSTGPFGDRWDSGLFGIICVSKEKVRKENNWKVITKKRRELIETALNSEIKVLDDYYTGTVYRWEITDNKGELVDSCGGYYGDEAKESLIEECKEIIDATIREEKRRIGNQLVIEFE